MGVPIATIVEGHGEEEALPVLIRRIAADFGDPVQDLELPKPIRVTRSRLMRIDELERAVKLAALKTGRRGGILVLIDSDDDCPAERAPRLLERITAARADLPAAIVMAKREFEAWFLAAAESLRGYRGLPEDLLSPADPEDVRGAKEWISQNMTAGIKYRPTLDQASFAATFDLGLARRNSPSFRKLCREIERLCSEVRLLPVRI